MSNPPTTTNNVEAPPPHNGYEGVDSLLYEAWSVIANAGQGDWGQNETLEWRKAAMAWRDRWFAYLDWASKRPKREG